VAPVGAMFAWDSADRRCLPIWQVSALLCIALQTVVLGWLARPRRVRFAWRFWLAVSCYASYPILIEAWPGIGPPLLTFGCSNVWPLSLTAGGFGYGSEWLTPTLLFYLWWLDLTIIAAARTCRSVWQGLLVCALIGAIAVAVSYFGRCCGEALF